MCMLNRCVPGVGCDERAGTAMKQHPGGLMEVKGAGERHCAAREFLHGGPRRLKKRE